MSKNSGQLGHVQVLGFLGVAMVVGIAILAFWSAQAYLNSSRWRVHTVEVIRELRSLRFELESAESNQRGLIITGDKAFLEIYSTTRTNIGRQMEIVPQMIRDNEAQVERFNKLAPIIRARVEYLETGLQLAKLGKMREAINWVKAGRGISLMGEIRAGLSAIEDEEERLLAERSDTAQRAFSRAIGVVVGGLLLALIFITATIYMLNSENKHRRKMEVDLKVAKDKALEASNLKSSFLANMSHEIRTPLNGIIGMSKLLEQTELNDRQHDYVETMKTSSNTLLVLINEILDLSKIESGKLQLEDAHFELKSLIKSTVAMVEFGAKSKGLEIITEVAGDVPEFYLGDPLRLRQVLLNLLNNSVKFSERGTIIVKVTTVGFAESRVRLFFEVTDNGVGMDQETRGKLFQSFSQGDSSTSRRYGGSGLGLAISREIVEMMNGRIDVESVKGVGSRFYFDVLLKVAKYDEIVQPVSFDKMLLKSLNGYLLVAEDNKVNQKVIIEMVKMLGCRCKVVENGALAVAALAKEEFNLVLMDGQMPQMDGYEATKRIRAGEAGENNIRVPIIATTANAIQGDIEKCLEAGMNDYIGKPISYDDLAFKVEKWMGRGRRVIDQNALDRIAKLAENGNLNLLYELIDLFRTETPTAIQRLRTTLTSMDYPRLTQTAHSLKSSTANMGALRMREISERIERARPDGNPHHVSILIDSLEREFKLAMEELDRIQTK